MGYTVILPTFNEEGHIVELIREIQAVFSASNQNYEIIIVDDNSKDGTIDSIKKIENDHDNLQLFVRENLRKNLAKSINLGIKKSKYENIIWMDADFQHPPDYIKLFHNYQKKYDLIFFSRFLKKSIRYFENNKSKKNSMKTKVFFLISYVIFFFIKI